MERETYYGYVETEADAIRLFEACRVGLLPRVQRRLSEKERQSIRPGSVFVWDEGEAGMRRWTDGKSWSASRIEESCLIYRELESKRGGHFFTKQRGDDRTPDSSHDPDKDGCDEESEGPDDKTDGLLKKSLRIITSNDQHLHLIWYYPGTQNGHSVLRRPTNDPELRKVVLVTDMYPKLNIGNAGDTPATTHAPMQQPPYVEPQNHQQSYDIYGQSGCISTPFTTADNSYKRHVSPYPPINPREYPPYASSPSLLLRDYAEVTDYEKSKLFSSISTEPHMADYFPNDRNPTLSTAQESSHEQYLKEVAQSAIDHFRYSSPYA